MLQAYIIPIRGTLAGAQCFMFFEPVMKCIVAPDSAVLRSRPQNIGAGKYGKESKTTRMDQR